MKNCIRLLLFVFLFIFSFSITTFAKNPETAQAPETGLLKSDTIQFDGKPLEFKTIVYKDRAYVSIRDLCYSLKCSIEVDSENRIINILKNQNSSQKPADNNKGKLQKPVIVTLNNSHYNIRSEGIDTYIESIIFEGRTYVPIRFFCEFFERKVDWLKDKNKISINKAPDVVIGTVNGQELYKKDFDFIYNPQYYRLKNSGSKEIPDADIKKLKDSSFDSLVLITILLQKVEASNMKLEESDYIQINSNLSGSIEANGGIENFRSLLAKNDVSLPQISKDSRNMALINKAAENLVKDIAAGEEKIKKYYDDNKNKYLESEKVRAKHILFMTMDNATGEGYDATKKEEIKKKALEVLDAIKAGANFDEQMNKYTEDPGTKSSPDGYTFSKGEMVKEFEDCSFSMNVGEISNLVETQYGYHIIKLEEKIPQKQLTLDEVRDQIKSILDGQEKQLYFNNLVEKWKSESKIENKMK